MMSKQNHETGRGRGQRDQDNPPGARSRIDAAALARAIVSTEDAIRPIKRRLRSPWPQGVSMAPAQYQLLRLRARATSLYALRASLRARLHIRVCPRVLRDVMDDPREWDPVAYNAELAADIAEEFRPAEASSSTATRTLHAAC